MKTAELKKLIASATPPHLLDVRTAKEFHDVRISGSRHMPVDQMDAAAVKQFTHDFSEPCVILCQSGGRATRAYESLQKAGATNLHVLEGGISDWMAAGGDVEKAANAGLPLMRQVQLTVGLLALSSSLLALTVDVKFALIPAFLGAGLTMAGATGWCGLAILLSRMPWNEKPSSSCSLPNEPA
jgi:rhodanese-related sulfurtransferase